MRAETKQTPPLSPPLAKVAAEFSLSGNVFNFPIFIFPLIHYTAGGVF
jgi:hypothetical protein